MGKIASKPLQIHSAAVDDIVVGDRLRRLDETKVAELVGSLQAIGLRTPISVRHADRIVTPERAPAR